LNADVRGWRLALVPFNVMNPGDARLPDALGIVESGGYGVLQLPPPGGYGPLLAVIADQIAEYSHHGYAVVAIGATGETENGLHWRSLVRLLRARCVELPPRHIIDRGAEVHAEGRRLAAFLSDAGRPTLGPSP